MNQSINTFKNTMAKDPAFLFYSQDFIVGVQTMNFEERGKYISILCQMHQQGRLSEETISFLVGSVSVNLKAKFRIDPNGLWFNERLEEETRKRNEFTESRRINGKMGGRPKITKPSGKPNGKHKGNLMGNENEDVIEDNNTIVLGEKNDQKPLIKIKRKYLTDKNFIIYGEDGYEQMMVEETTRGVPDAEKPFLAKFMREKNGCIYEGSPSFVINSFKTYIKNLHK